MTDDIIPEGFKLLQSSKPSPFILKNGPFYGKLNEDQPELAFRVSSDHLNSFKICHGGMLMTFLDATMSMVASFALGGKRRGVTLEILNVGFENFARRGSWVFGSGTSELIEEKEDGLHVTVRCVLKNDAGKELTSGRGKFRMPAKDEADFDMRNVFR